MSSSEATNLLFEELEDGLESRRRETFKDLILGYSCAFGYAMCITFTSAILQVLDQSLSATEVMALTAISMIILTGSFLITKRQSPSIDIRDMSMPKVALVAVLDIAIYVLYFIASKYINLAPIGGLQKASTLIIAFILAKVILHEDIKAHKVIAVVLNVAGFIFFIIPIFLPNHGNGGQLNSLQAPPAPTSFIDHTNTSQDSHLHLDGETNNSICYSNGENATTVLPTFNLVIGYLVVLVAGMINAVEIIIVSGYMQHMSQIVLCFWIGIFGVLICTILMIYTGSPTPPSDPVSIVLMAVSGLSGALGTLFYIGTMHYISASKAVLSQSIHIVLMVLVQYTIMGSFNYEDSVLPPWSMWPGIVLVTIGVLIVPIRDLVIPTIYAKFEH